MSETMLGVCPECSPTTLITLTLEDREVTCSECGEVVDYITETRSERRERRLQERREKRMKVGELISALEGMPEDATIHIYCSGAFAEPKNVEEREVEWNTGHEETIVEIK